MTGNNVSLLRKCRAQKSSEREKVCESSYRKV